MLGKLLLLLNLLILPLQSQSQAIPHVNLGACPAQSNSLTSLYLTYTSDSSNRVNFTVNGWYTDALPTVIRIHQYYNMTPRIPKYIYFAHPPDNPRPVSKIEASYYTGKTANTCDNLDFTFSGHGWNVDRVNLLSTTSLFDVQVSVKRDYVIKYLLDSNALLTYAFMTPNTICSLLDIHNTACWCPVLQVQMPISWLSQNPVPVPIPSPVPVPIPSPVPVPIPSPVPVPIPSPVPVPIPSPVPVPIPSTLCKLFTVSLQPIQAISNTCDACFYECNSNNDCDSYSWMGSSFINWGNDTFCESLLTPPTPSPVPLPIPSPSPVPVPIPSTSCKLFTISLQPIQAISNTCDTCWYECNSNNDCAFYSWNESQIISWGIDTFCESLLTSPTPVPVPIPSPVPVPIPSPVPVPIPSPVPVPIPSPVPVPIPSPTPAPVPSGTIPRVDVGSCPGTDQYSYLTSLYITFQPNIATNRMTFTINGWNNDALPSSVRSNPLYSITPVIPKYIYFAHPPTNPTPSSKSIANYFTKTTSNTCDNFNFNFGGYGWNVDRVNLLSITSLVNVQVSVNLDYVYNYLLDSNKMLTYAFMTPNSACGPSNPNNNHCWCPVLQVQIN